MTVSDLLLLYLHLHPKTHNDHFCPPMPGDVCHCAWRRWWTADSRTRPTAEAHFLSTINNHCHKPNLDVAPASIFKVDSKIGLRATSVAEASMAEHPFGLFLCSSNFQSSCPLKCIDGADQDSRRMYAPLWLAERAGEPESWPIRRWLFSASTTDDERRKKVYCVFQTFPSIAD